MVAPGHQLIRAREIIARVRSGAFIDADDDETGDWRIDAVPGKVGDLDEAEIRGVLGPTKKAGAVVIILAFAVFPVAGCLLTAVGG